MKPPKTAKELFSNSKAELFSSSLVNNAHVISHLQDSAGETFTLEDCVVELAKQSEAIKGGSIDQPEEILFYQAKALDTLFCSLVKRSSLNMGEYFNAADKYMRLALRAQSKCRATLETLVEIKNPKQPIIQNNIQANTAQYQQVQNNPESLTPSSRARGKKIKMGNELLDQGATHEPDNASIEQRLDFGEAETSVGAHQAMATVEA